MAGKYNTLSAELEGYRIAAKANVVKAVDLLLVAMDEYCRHTSCEVECCVGKRGCKAFNRKMRDYLEGIKARFAIAEEGAEDGN